MDRIAVMLRQECKVYECGDYVSGKTQKFSTLQPSPRRAKWRAELCDWCYKVIDKFDFSRELVAIAMSYLDRYQCTTYVDCTEIQLACLAALYLSVKLHGTTRLSMAYMVELSNHRFTAKQVALTEAAILQ